MSAEFTLLCYHQLVLLSDSDEAQAVTVWGERVDSPAPLTEGPWNDDLPHSIPPMSPVSPRDNRPADTPKTLYRWNHVSDRVWNGWGFTARRLWSEAMRKNYSKTVVW